MKYHEIPTASFKPSSTWRVIYWTLADLDPDEVDRVSDVPEGMTAWDLTFTQDLVQIQSTSGDRLIDVGWYPDGEPTGSYRLELLARDSKSGEVDWEAPLKILETRSLSRVINELMTLAGAR